MGVEWRGARKVEWVATCRRCAWASHGVLFNIIDTSDVDGSKGSVMGRRATGKLSGASVSELRRELMRRGKRVGGLEKRRKRLLDKISRINVQISELGGATGMAAGSISGRRRPKNASNLVDALTKTLTGKVMSVTEVTEAVQKAGYSTTSPNFRTIVNQALIASGKFKRVERGHYTAK